MNGKEELFCNGGRNVKYGVRIPHGATSKMYFLDFVQCAFFMNNHLVP